jgi:hypothetical protein
MLWIFFKCRVYKRPVHPGGSATIFPGATETGPLADHAADSGPSNDEKGISGFEGPRVPGSRKNTTSFEAFTLLRFTTYSSLFTVFSVYDSSSALALPI